jgi:hypothetical protein
MKDEKASFEYRLWDLYIVRLILEDDDMVEKNVFFFFFILGLPSSTNDGTIL